jgi:hypothetical protein
MCKWVTSRLVWALAETERKMQPGVMYWFDINPHYKKNNILKKYVYQDSVPIWIFAFLQLEYSI